MIDLAPRSLWGQPVIVGAGIAGCVAALTLAPHPVILLDPSTIGFRPATGWAQGGLAAAVGADDSSELHARDTVAAGAGLTDPDVAARITAAGPPSIAMLEEFGVRFDRTAQGGFALGLEAAHSRRRILHVRDATGAALLTALSARIDATPTITRLPGSALELSVENGSVTGIVVELDGKPVFLPTARIILATGGVGGLWRSTTNPPSSRGSGLALAAQAGAGLADLEFMQFHPTALAVGADPMPLVSEAVRGEGAVLIDGSGARFMADTPGGDLAPRDVVARAVFRRWADGDSAALDVRQWPAGQFAARFPNIFHVLGEFGLDPTHDPIPVRPAAHYHMGGVAVGPTGRTSIDGLWACGEVACTRLHGANRLASNSLLEAVVCGREAGEQVSGAPAGRLRTGDTPTPPAFRSASPETFDRMRAIMETGVGVIRNAAGLSQAVDALRAILAEADGTDAVNPVAISLLIASAALRRTESRGAHFRDDAVPQTVLPAHSKSEWAELQAS